MSGSRVAVFKMASCDGCQLQLLDAEDALLELAGAVEIVNFAEASRMTGPVFVRWMTSMPNPRSVMMSQRACSNSSK